MSAHKRAAPVAAMATTLALLAGPCAAQDGERLRLVASTPWAIVFMPETAAASPPLPREVTHWTFFDPADRLTSAWGWNTRVSRERIDCQAGRMSPVRHQTFQNDVLVEETTPPFRMRAPTGPDHLAILSHVCGATEPPQDVVVDDVAAARTWANEAFQRMKAGGS